MCSDLNSSNITLGSVLPTNDLLVSPCKTFALPITPHQLLQHAQLYYTSISTSVVHLYNHCEALVLSTYDSTAYISRAHFSENITFGSLTGAGGPASSKSGWSVLPTNIACLRSVSPFSCSMTRMEFFVFEDDHHYVVHAVIKVLRTVDLQV